MEMPSPQYPESPSSHSPAFLWPSHHQLRLLLSLLSNWPPAFILFFFVFFFFFHTIARITLSTQSQTLSLLSSNSCKAPLHSEGKPESCVIYTALCTLALITYYHLAASFSIPLLCLIFLIYPALLANLNTPSLLLS